MNQLTKVENKTEIFNFAESDMKTCMKMAEMMSISDLVPKDFKQKPGNILLAVQMGSEVGLKPMQALQNVAVINGRPCLWGDAVMAVIQSSGLLESFDETFNKGTMTATCVAKRKDIEHPYTAEFSKEDAEKAGLWSKTGPWKTYPKRMLALRARGFCMRNGFADVLGGFHVAEEIRDLPPEKVVGEKAAEVADMLNVPATEGKAVNSVEEATEEAVERGRKAKEAVEKREAEARLASKPVDETTRVQNQTTEEWTDELNSPAVEDAEFTEISVEESLIEKLENAQTMEELNSIVPQLSEAPEGSKKKLREIFVLARENLLQGN